MELMGVLNAAGFSRVALITDQSAPSTQKKK
jgi:hypothetical protein